jgi:hypothetical protein
VKHAVTAVIIAIGLVGAAACTLVAAPVQCASDDDCLQFDARCDIGQGVCAPPNTESTEGTFTAPLDASTKPAPPAASSAPAASATTEPGPSSVSAPVDAGSGTQDATTQTLVAAIHCGGAKCDPTKEVCCIRAAGPTCTAAADCADVPVACDDTSDCAAAGSTGICCGYNDGANPPALLRAQCVPPDQCDANGPQDQLCSLKGPATQCDTSTTGPGSTCQSFTYSNATYAFCVGP